MMEYLEYISTETNAMFTKMITGEMNIKDFEKKIKTTALMEKTIVFTGTLTQMTRDEVKALATHITKSNNENGVAYALENILKVI